MAKEFKISTLRLKELEQELFYLKTTREKEVAEQIKDARTCGELSETREYAEKRAGNALRTHCRGREHSRPRGDYRSK